MEKYEIYGRNENKKNFFSLGIILMLIMKLKE
jgi:hypothetical protein